MQIQDEKERDDDALDTKAAAKFLACSSSKLNKLRVTGGGPMFIKHGRSVRYLRADLHEYRNTRKRRSTNDTSADPAHAAA
jgi:hypothetical protein